ncbi:GTPase HflX [Alsobacter sp. SYSU M60028]|uniref:GTPase HflX n=1 Tax=Alsobacter ponti TaxID=2962936 RepID=A0ABT1L9K3_9HYPH|nr:GTPase HflX [Alsobacter ponti]MCP8938170.1 GTPase HflX [Alsobacter ponti]
MTGPNIPKDAPAKRAVEPEKKIASGTRTLVVGPYLSARGRMGAEGEGARVNLRIPQARLDEAVGLAAAIDLDVVQSLLVTLASPRPATYLGKGKVEEIEGLIRAEEIDLVMMDCALSPVQQRNLEKAWGAKVIDRTGLILEIFGRRARTKEGALQVELAHLNYQKSRLVRSWTHLERQRGGFGFLGGPGETQIEADRRLIQERMVRIERELENVKRTRGLHRESRRKVPYPIVALVGYTNAGKSTLFNRLTSAEVFAENLLFATLDPTARVVKLPHGAPIILSDTVGFISDLPTMLVAAFRATLEDVISADVILHVRDVSHIDTEAQSADVTAILKDLGLNPDDHARIVEVWNKADLLTPEDHDRLMAVASHRPTDAQPVVVSALTGEGIDRLKAAIEQRLSSDRPVYRVELDPADGAGLHWLYQEAEILDRRNGEDGAILLAVRLAVEKEARLLRRFPGARRLR